MDQIKRFRLLYVGIISVLIACTNCDNKDSTNNESRVIPTKVISEETKSDRTIKEGVICAKEDTIGIVREGKCIAIIHLSEPIIVAQATEDYEWGFFQFPTLYRNERGELIVDYQMKPDSYTSYGEETNVRVISKDEGVTWESSDDTFFQKDRYRVELSDGDVLQVYTPKALDIKDFKSFPNPVNSSPLRARYIFYNESELPVELRGAYLVHWNSVNGKADTVHTVIKDPGLLRYAIDGYMPVVWWGNIRELKDHSLVAGVYPGYYLNSRGEVLTSATSFYISKDKGYNWDLLGKIPFQEGGDIESFTFDSTEKEMSEPTFEILKDGSYICVMRTWGVFPLMRSFSKDGHEWSTPEYFTPNGVMPDLCLLDNGVLVLASGRPGIQIRFSIDGDGYVWSQPIDMMPFMKNSSDYDIYVSCGYPSILKKSENTFYIVYSDFTTKDSSGNIRKSILFRKVEVDRI